MNHKLTKPNFLIAGAPRCGSTTLFKLLSLSDEVYMPANKEPHFYVSDLVGDGPGHEGRNTVSVLSGYEALFDSDESRSAVVRGECSIGYMNFHSSSVAKIQENLGVDVRIILTLRHPVERAYSSYVLHRQVGNEPLSFEEAIEANEVNRRKSEGYWFGYRYLELSLYSSGLKSFLEAFRNVHVLIADDYKANPFKHMCEVCRFLGIDDGFVGQLNLDEKHNSASVPYIAGLRRITSAVSKRSRFLGPTMAFVDQLNSYRPKLSEATRARLNDYFLPDVEEVEMLLGRDLESWKR